MSVSKMLDEVRQQPEALERTLRSELPRIRQLQRRVAERRLRFIVLVARGTSDNAAQFGRYLLEISTGIPVSLSAPSIFTLYKADVDLSGSLVVAISQSGESTDTNLVLERARKKGALTVGITNEASSPLAHICDYAFLVRAGKEKSVAATLRVGLRAHAAALEELATLERDLERLSGEPLAAALQAHAALHDRLAALGGARRDHAAGNGGAGVPHRPRT